jgi:Fe-S-cluster containining protein
MRYNLYHKIRQLIVYLRPIDETRTGRCTRCGACCKFMFKCPFLGYSGGKAVCKINRFKMYTCSKYPLNAKEHHTRDVCGFRFGGPSMASKCAEKTRRRSFRA